MIEKFNQIINWFNTNNTEDELAELITNPQTGLFQKIEALLGEPLPEDFKKFYSYCNGEKEGGERGLFVGDIIFDLDGVIRELEYSKDNAPIESPTIPDPKKANQCFDQIVNLVQPPIKEIFNPKDNNYKIDFKCSGNSISSPIYYPNKDGDQSNFDNPKTGDSLMDAVDTNKIMKYAKEVQKFESEAFGWSELKFNIFGDGSYSVEREIFDFTEDLSSYPPKAIKLRYYHPKWLPIFTDAGGNHIGIDLDPDVNGKKGQIIVWGRDEDQMFVFGDNLESFFDLVLKRIERRGTELIKWHLHDELKKEINPDVEL